MPGRTVTDFGQDSAACIEASKTPQRPVERIYRNCMLARGWTRVQTPAPTARQFRGPEELADFAWPPDPLAERETGPTRPTPSEAECRRARNTMARNLPRGVTCPEK